MNPDVESAIHLLLLADHLEEEHTGQVTLEEGGLQDQAAEGLAGLSTSKGTEEAGQHFLPSLYKIQRK